MSIVAVTIRPDDYVMMACDGVCTDPATGNVKGYVSKMHVMPDLGALMGVTGFGGLGEALRFHMPVHVACFDDLLDAMPGLLAWAWAGIETEFGPWAYRSCVSLAGWSDQRGKFEGWRITTYDKDRVRPETGERATVPAFTLGAIPDRGIWATAGEDPAILRRFGVIGGPDTDDDGDRLVRVICAGRAESGQATEEGLPFNVGGFVQLAHLVRGHAQTWITHRWPEDVIGRPIDPARGQPLPDHLMAHYDAQA